LIDFEIYPCFFNSPKVVGFFFIILFSVLSRLLSE